MIDRYCKVSVDCNMKTLHGLFMLQFIAVGLKHVKHYVLMYRLTQITTDIVNYAHLRAKVKTQHRGNTTEQILLSLVLIILHCNREVHGSNVGLYSDPDYFTLNLLNAI